MTVRLLLGALGVFHLANGLWMLVFPDLWAIQVVHLPRPDHLHLHFIADIAMAFLASGTGLVLGARRGASFAYWAVAGATWPLLHGFVHLHGWLMDGLPPTMALRLQEGFGVMFTGALGAILAWLRYRQGEL